MKEYLCLGGDKTGLHVEIPACSLPRESRPGDVPPEQGMKFYDHGDDGSDSGLENLLE